VHYIVVGASPYQDFGLGNLLTYLLNKLFMYAIET